MQILKQMVWVGAAAVFTAAAAPAATAATNGTVRADLGELIDQSIDFNQGDEIPQIGGVTITSATGFLLIDIDNSSVLDAELTFRDIGGTLLRTFDESSFAVSITGNDLKAGFDNVSAADLDMGNYRLVNGSQALTLDLANETGLYTQRFVSSPGFSPQYTLFNDNPTLTFTPLPEPASAGLMLALGGLLLRRRHAC